MDYLARADRLLCAAYGGCAVFILRFRRGAPEPTG
jgi:hypothetical protein